jgi:hypothetical protein
MPRTVRSSERDIGYCENCGQSLSDRRTYIGVQKDGPFLVRTDICDTCDETNRHLMMEEDRA